MVGESHALPHVPQFVELLEVSVHAPLQTISALGHAHAPLVHVAPVAQVVPHAPQLLSSFEVSTHVPPQFTWPDAQQMPDEHVCPEEHAVAQFPQCVASV